MEIKQLLSKMTLEQKLAQMSQFNAICLMPDSQGGVTGPARSLSLTNEELPLLRRLNKNKSEGVVIKFDLNGALNVDVYIRVYIGYSVPDIAYRVQENIKNSLNSMVGIKPGKINVHVCGVAVDEDIK